MLDLIGNGEVLTIDVARLHNLSHPRITYLIGDSVSEEIVEFASGKAASCSGPVMVVLDSDHSRDHVMRELECYTPLVTPGSYCLVQDGVIDTLWSFRAYRPGPLPAIREFLKSNDKFEIDHNKTEKFLVTYHPDGWLRRKI